MTEDYKKNTARAIKQRRISMGLNLKEVAARSGVSSSHLGRIERGERSPSFTVLRKIVNPLGFGEKELLALAGYLPSSLLAKFRVGQSTVIGILGILKSIAREHDTKRTPDATDMSG